MNRSLHYIAFAVGLAAVCWVGAGYVGSNPLALAITLLIGAFYLMGALELRRFHQATDTLARAVAQTNAPPAGLGQWLAALHPSLQNAVRLRIEGERVGLPGPALTPYLAGLLVLLGMLGTFLGMVVTLNGTGLALENATDVQAVRASLSAPVKGLGLAFGTSVAGVAASAMLGLLSALCRRDRLQAAQMLDTRIATTLRVFSRAHRRDESFELLQQQAAAMPQLVDRLQAMMAAMEQQSQALDERLVASQDRFHIQAEAAYAGLASSVGLALKESLTDSARVAGATIQPVVEATMAGIAREALASHSAIQQEASASHTAIQREALALHKSIEGQASALHANIERQVQQQLEGISTRFEALAEDSRASHEQFAQTFEQRSAALIEGVAARLDTAADGVSAHWRSALAQPEHVSEGLSRDTQGALAALAARFEQHSASLLQTVEAAHGSLQTGMAAKDQQRLAAWTGSLEAMAASLQEEWQQAGAHAVRQHQEIGQTLAQTASDIAARSEAHASHTIGEITRLVQAASEAPRAAAEVIAELRQQLSDSMVRDNTMLEERSRLLGTLATVLEGVNHAATEQRAAIDALVGNSADLLDRIGTRFTDNASAQTGKMAEVAAQITGSAVEVASLGEAFGLAVQLFAQSNDKMGAHLQRIEAALAKSTARSDEQLAYYVAQAREVIDLSIMSQKQIVEDLQELAVQREQQRALQDAEPRAEPRALADTEA
ncbi:hypothetical protein BH11PSE9_BH11PSE9_22340 [soil metagenome]